MMWTGYPSLGPVAGAKPVLYWAYVLVSGDGAPTAVQCPTRLKPATRVGVFLPFRLVVCRPVAAREPPCGRLVVSDS